MTGRWPLLAVALSTLGVAAAYLPALVTGTPPAWAPFALALGTMGLLVSLMALGSHRNGRIGALAIPFAFVLVVIGGGLVALLLLPPADAADPRLVWGLPRGAAFLLYGIGLLPTLIVPVAYALTFDRLTLSDDDLERVRRMAAANRGEDHA